jgi:hypothetical protein
MTNSSSSVEFKDYEDESQLEHVMKLVTKDLSEPYSSEFFTLGARKPSFVEFLLVKE